MDDVENDAEKTGTADPEVPPAVVLVERALPGGEVFPCLVLEYFQSLCKR